MKKIRVKIETLSPIVLATRTNTTVMTSSHDFFSGTLVRGMLAERYIEAKNLGDQAQEDENFLGLFFDKLRFVAAYPVRASDGKRASLVPASVQRLKDGEAVRDLLSDAPEAGYKTLRGFAVIEDGGIEKVDVAKNISLHMSRSNVKERQGKERGSSSLERLAGRSRDGAIYNYEAVEKGVRFEGEVFGEDAALESFMDALGTASWTAQAGRARHAQYGACRVQLEPVEFMPESVEPDADNRISLRLETPLLAADDLLSSAAAALQQIVDRLNEGTAGGFSLHAYDPKRSAAQGDVENTVFADFVEVDNFVGIWGMKRPRAVALAAGSVFAVEKESAWTESDKERLQRLLYDGVGARTEEGFGQLRLWHLQPLSLAKRMQQKERRAVRSPEVRKGAKKLLLCAAQRKMVVYAAEDVQKLTGGEGTAHFFARLDSMWVHGRTSALGEEICSQKGNASTPFAKKLREVKLNGRSLEELLMKANIADMPYNKERRWKKELGEDLEAFLEDIGEPGFLSSTEAQDELFYAYWHDFFRFARKAAAGKGGEE